MGAAVWGARPCLPTGTPAALLPGVVQGPAGGGSHSLRGVWLGCRRVCPRKGCVRVRLLSLRGGHWGCPGVHRRRQALQDSNTGLVALLLGQVQSSESVLCGSKSSALSTPDPAPSGAVRIHHRTPRTWSCSSGSAPRLSSSSKPRRQPQAAATCSGVRASADLGAQWSAGAALPGPPGSPGSGARHPKVALDSPGFAF